MARQAASGRFGADVDANLEVEATFDGGEGGWSGGTHCAIVEVDVETGLVKVERYVVAEDCGALINPAVVEGQIRGGVAQGIGAVLLERSAYDQDGKYQSATFMDYLLPTACDIPRIEIEHLETVPLDADVNFRGVGEGGMIVAPPTVVQRHRGRARAVRRADLRAAPAPGPHPGAHRPASVGLYSTLMGSPRRTGPPEMTSA